MKHLAVAVMFLAAAALRAEEPAAGGATIQEVFERLQAATAKKDWAGFLDATTPARRNVLLWRVVAGALIGAGLKDAKMKDFEALLAREGVQKDYDKDFYMPHSLADLEEALAPSYADIKDFRGSFVVIITWVGENTDVLAGASTTSKLENIIEKGDRANASAVDSSGGRQPVSFERVAGRWYLAADGPGEKIQAPTPLPGSEKSPDATEIGRVFQQTQSAVAKRDWAAWFELLPPNRRRAFLFRILDRAGSTSKRTKLGSVLERVGLPNSFDKELSGEKSIDKLEEKLKGPMSGVKDLKTAFVEVGAWVEFQTESTAGFSFVWAGRLGGIKVQGDDAAGTLVKASGSSTPLKFRRVEGHWYLEPESE